MFELTLRAGLNCTGTILDHLATVYFLIARSLIMKLIDMINPNTGEALESSEEEEQVVGHLRFHVD